MTQGYVLGFMFSDCVSKVVLIKKNRPIWQKGLLNGVGGHIEEGEDSHTAMVREFQEETGVYYHDWDHFLTMRFPGCFVDCFTAVDETSVKNVKSITDEDIVICCPTFIDEFATIDNIPHLIEMAKQFLVCSI